MKRIAYLLHRFPAITDTFIKREIRGLQKLGTHVEVISVWKPAPSETTPAILSEWQAETHFVLPRSMISIIGCVLGTLFRAPGRFFSTFRLALSTSKPGVRGNLYQLYYFLESVLAADIIRQRSIDHIHNHIGDQSGTVTMLAAHLAGIGYSITFHGWPVFFDAQNSRIKEKVLAANFTRAISYFCRSQLMMFSDSQDIGPFKIVHCGLEIEKYKYRPPRKEVKWLFCAARLSYEKGLFFLVHAVKLLRDRGYDIELKLAGDGPSRVRLERLAAQLNISRYVHLLGFKTESEVNAELQQSDLFVLPSFVEGLPVSAMEAMAIGVPVIATNIAGTGELVETEKSGLLIRPSDTEALVEAVVRMIGDYDFRLRVSQSGRCKVVDEFDIEIETRKLNEYLLEACR